MRALLATKTTYLRATWWAATVGKVLCVVGMVVGLVYQPLLMVLFAFIFFAGEMEYRAAKRREVEDAHWRAVLARHHIIEIPVEEPPFLSR